jgi:hypothetical protein
MKFLIFILGSLFVTIPLISENSIFQTIIEGKVKSKNSTETVILTLENNTKVEVDSDTYNSIKTGDIYKSSSYTLLSWVMIILGSILILYTLAIITDGKIFELISEIF